MSTAKANILLAEDDSSLAFIVKDALEEEGYTVMHYDNGQDAIEGFDKSKFDVCLLDIMMPARDGYLVAKKIRKETDMMPIIFMSTKGLLDDRLKGYETGADDYLVKPFSMQELLKKIEVFLRRSKKLLADLKMEYKLGSIVFSNSDLKINTPLQSINITQKEADLLQFLCDHQNKLVRREEVLVNVWGKDDFFLGRSMDVYMTRLRKYLKADPEVQLETVHGIGFRLSVPENSSKKS